MKKILFGIFVATTAIVVSTLTTNATNQQREYETVVLVSANQWMIVDPQEQGMTWDCFNGGTKCRGVLEPHALPNSSGYYDDSDVSSWVTNTHYEAIP